jgi:hypothetical protein
MVILVLYVVKCQNIFFLSWSPPLSGRRNGRPPRSTMAATRSMKGEWLVHEFRPNTNIKFICPRFQKEMF